MADQDYMLIGSRNDNENLIFWKTETTGKELEDSIAQRIDKKQYAKQAYESYKSNYPSNPDHVAGFNAKADYWLSEFPDDNGRGLAAFLNNAQEHNKRLQPAIVEGIRGVEHPWMKRLSANAHKSKRWEKFTKKRSHWFEHLSNQFRTTINGEVIAFDPDKHIVTAFVSDPKANKNANKTGSKYLAEVYEYLRKSNMVDREGNVIADEPADGAVIVSDHLWHTLMEGSEQSFVAPGEVPNTDFGKRFYRDSKYTLSFLIQLKNLNNMMGRY